MHELMVALDRMLKRIDEVEHRVGGFGPKGRDDK